MEQDVLWIALGNSASWEALGVVIGPWFSVLYLDAVCKFKSPFLHFTVEVLIYCLSLVFMLI